MNISKYLTPHRRQFIYYGPEDEGGSGGGNDSQTGGNDTQAGGAQLDPITGLPMAGQSESDPFADALAVFADSESKQAAAAAQKKKDADLAQQQAMNPATMSANLANQMKDLIGGFMIDESIMKDKDMTDPVQAKGVLEASIRSALPVMFNTLMLPVKAQFQAMQAEYKRLIAEGASSAVESRSETERLNREVPLLEDPTHGPLLRQMLVPISDRPLPERVKALKAVISRLGLDATTKTKQASDGTTQVVKSGSAAVDEFFSF